MPTSGITTPIKSYQAAPQSQVSDLFIWKFNILLVFAYLLLRSPVTFFFFFTCFCSFCVVLWAIWQCTWRRWSNGYRLFAAAFLPVSEHLLSFLTSPLFFIKIFFLFLFYLSVIFHPATNHVNVLEYFDCTCWIAYYINADFVSARLVSWNKLKYVLYILLAHTMCKSINAWFFHKILNGQCCIFQTFHLLRNF